MITQSDRCGSVIARALPTSSPSTSATRWTDGDRSGSHDGMRVARLIRGRAGSTAGTPRLRRCPSGEAWTRRERAASAWRSVSRAARTAPEPSVTSPPASRSSRPAGGAAAGHRSAPGGTRSPARGPGARPPGGRRDRGRGPRRAAPTSVTIGARMKTPCSGAPPRDGTSRSASKLSSCRPYPLRVTRDVEQPQDRLVAVRRSGRRGGSCPAQVPSIGQRRRAPARGSARAARTASISLRMVVDSPPGRIERVEADEVARQPHLTGSAPTSRGARRDARERALERQDADPRRPAGAEQAVRHRSTPTSRGRPAAPPPGSRGARARASARPGRRSPRPGSRGCRSGWWP